MDKLSSSLILWYNNKPIKKNSLIPGSVIPRRKNWQNKRMDNGRLNFSSQLLCYIINFL